MESETRLVIMLPLETKLVALDNIVKISCAFVPQSAVITQSLDKNSFWRAQRRTSFGVHPEEVGHGLKGIMVGRISESRTLFYRGHEINMAGF